MEERGEGRSSTSVTPSNTVALNPASLKEADGGRGEEDAVYKGNDVGLREKRSGPTGWEEAHLVRQIEKEAPGLISIKRKSEKEK